MMPDWDRWDIIHHCAKCAATGNKIDLRCVVMRWADLRDMDLSGADMTGSDLRGTDLRCANLRGARLCGADLRWPELHKADVTGAIGIVCLHVDDPRGYRPIAVDHGTHWMIASGCRWLTAADALAHWGEDDYHTPELGQAYCRAIRELPPK